MAADSLEPAIGALLAQSGRSGADFRVEPLAIGGNNRVFFVRCGAERLVAKWYWHDPADSRDRLAAEFAFLEHAWRIGLRCVPRPVVRDSATHLALYEYVEGAKVGLAGPDAAQVREATDFFSRLNSAHSRAAAGALPSASEACFSTSAHLAMVDTRIGRLALIEPGSPADREAIEFASELASRWAGAKAAILASLPDPDRVLVPQERCLSPSDFGFHNALRRPDGHMCFIDFEYAGWDDPAKAVGDFFAHPGSPVSRTHYEAFLAAATAPFPDPEAMAARARILDPVFRVKWCCIILNEFLPAEAKRRRFADATRDPAARKGLQLGKARALFDTLEH